MRSNDIWKGTTFDLPNFFIFQQTMLMFLRERYPKLELGWYSHHVGSCHVYEENFGRVEAMRDSGVQELPLLLNSPLIDLTGQPTTQTRTFYNSCATDTSKHVALQSAVNTSFKTANFCI
jgi:thymidylate synthase